MVRRSHKRRKRFSCGHLGFGRFCHRCVQIIHTDETRSPAATNPTASRKPQSRRAWRTTAKKLAKRQWQASFAHDPINLSHLPKPIVIKTRQILAQLNQGIPPSQLQGKRFNFDRTLLRIPVTYRYRLLCRWYADRVVPLQVLSHEAYNAIARNKRRVKDA